MRSLTLDQTAEGLATAIRKALRGLRYGSIEIVIHDSKVVRVERRERIRVDLEAEETPLDPSPTATAEANRFSRA
jgi:hypothetical protein